MTESERLKLHIWSLHESRDGPAMAELRHMIAGMVGAYGLGDDKSKFIAIQYQKYLNQVTGANSGLGNALHGPLYYGQRYSSD